MNPFPFWSNSAHASLNAVRVYVPTYKPSSPSAVLKLSRIMAINRFRKIKETTIMKEMKKAYAAPGDPQPWTPSRYISSYVWDSLQSNVIDLDLPQSYMSICQDSPVDILNRVNSAPPNVWKLAWWLRASWSFTGANRDTPNTEYRNKNKNKRPPTFVSYGMAPMKV